MSMDAYIIFPNTPLAKRVSLETLRQLQAQGQIQNDTPCIHVGDPTLLTVQDLLRAHSARATWEAVHRGDDGGAPDPAPIHLRPDPSGITEEERYYLLSNALVSPRDLPHLDRSSALRLIGGHSRRQKMKRVYFCITVAAVLAVAGGAALWMLTAKAAANEPAANEADATTIAAATKAAKADKAPALSPEEARKQRLAEKMAAREAAAKKNAETMKLRMAADRAAADRATAEANAAEVIRNRESDALAEAQRLEREANMTEAERRAAALERESRREMAVASWIDEKLSKTPGLRNQIGVLFDISKGSFSSTNYLCSGVVAEWNGKRYFFCPISALLTCAEPEAQLVSGETLKLRTLPLVVFGMLDVVGVCLGDAAPVTDAEKTALASSNLDTAMGEQFKRLVVKPVDLGDTSNGYAVGISRLAPGQISVRTATAELGGDGYWQLSSNATDELSGFILIDARRGSFMGVIAPSGSAVRGTPKYLAFNIGNISDPNLIAWETLLSELKSLAQIKERTLSFKALADNELSQPLPDARMQSLVWSMSNKVKTALAKQTPSLRDTTRIREIFFGDLARLNTEDIQPQKFTVPVLQSAVIKQKELRLKYIEEAKKQLKDEAFLKVN